MGLYDRDYMKEKARTERERAGMGWNTTKGSDLNVKDAIFWMSLGLNIVLLIALFR